MTLKIENANLNIKKDKILTNINLELEPGKIYGLLGRNGAGKTSLLSLIASYRKASGGSITLGGKKVYEQDDVMQHINFLYNPKETSAENDKITEYIESGSIFRSDFDKEYAYRLLETFDINSDKAYSKLSQGQQAAVTATLGLASLSKVTIFDEVTNGMDAPTRELFYSEVLEAANREERIIILSTHIISEMEHLFDEIIMIHKGEVLLHESTDELLEKGYTVTGKAERVRTFTENKKVINVKSLGALQIDTVLGAVTPEEMEIAEDGHLDISPLKLQEMFISLTDKKKDKE